MKIDEKLNLVVTVERDGGNLYVHSAPIGLEVFERYFLVIAKTFAAIYSEGLNIVAGPRVAGMMLKKISTDLDMWGDVSGGLVAEIRRLSNVAIPGDDGWRTVPLQDAINKHLFDADEVAEIDGIITFFTCASVMHRAKQVRPIIEAAASLWKAQITSLDATAFAASLPTLMSADPTETRAGLSVPT